MAYFLGRDVKVAITLEAADKTLSYDGATVAVASTTASPQGMHERDLASQALFTGNQTSSTAKTNPVTNLTGVDIGLGAVDEDIAYIGQRTALKAEIKKESTVTLTLKKNNHFYSQLFNGFRYGVATGGAKHDGLTIPGADFGYRVHVMLNSSGEIVTLKNCTLTEYGTTVNADGVTEETVSFMSHVTPHINDGVDADNIAITGSEL